MNDTVSASPVRSPSLLPEVAVSILHERPSSPLKLAIWGSCRMVSPTSFCPPIRQRLGPVDESGCPLPSLTC